MPPRLRCSAKRWVADLRPAAFSPARVGPEPAAIGTSRLTGPDQPIFIVSLHKVGTRSTHAFIESLGYTGIHYPKYAGDLDLEDWLERRGASRSQALDAILERFPDCQVFSDVPIPGLYREALARFPDATFILVTRDPRYWWNTLYRHWHLRKGSRRLDYFEYLQYAPYDYPRERPVSRADRDLFMRIFEQHERDVTALFAQSSNFLKTNLDQDHLEPELAQFLGAEHYEPMPYVRTGNRQVTSKLGHLVYRLRSRLAR